MCATIDSLTLHGIVLANTRSALGNAGSTFQLPASTSNFKLNELSVTRSAGWQAGILNYYYQSSICEFLFGLIVSSACGLSRTWAPKCLIPEHSQSSHHSHQSINFTQSLRRSVHHVPCLRLAIIFSNQIVVSKVPIARETFLPVLANQARAQRPVE